MNLLKILYIEDNIKIRETICELLQCDTRHIVACADSEAALGLLSAEKFDVIITDISLPGMSGTELTRRVVMNAPEQWVVLCSGYELPKDLTKLGSNVRSITKPFDIEDLEKLLDEATTNLKATPLKTTDAR
jgi:two-component system, cell cycle response regulator CpdR